MNETSNLQKAIRNGWAALYIGMSSAFARELPVCVCVCVVTEAFAYVPVIKRAA
jgi:hypothetical protein